MPDALTKPDRPYFFRVEGQFRDYDVSTFCSNAWSEAIQFAQDWLEEAADGRDIGEDCSVQFFVDAGKLDRCYGHDDHECLAEHRLWEGLEADDDE